MPRRPGSDSGLHPPTTPAGVMLARDYPARRLERLVATGSATRLHRGAYRLNRPGDGPGDRLLAQVVAAHHQTSGNHCFGHTSAALLHGLTTWRTAAKVELYQASTASSRSAPHIMRHSPMPPVEDRADVLGLPATTLGRTAWDCMTVLPARDALVVADAALHAFVEPSALASFARPRRRGHDRALRILAVADEGAESAPETMCRYRLLVAGFPTPTTQIPIETRLGTFWGDLGWSRWRVLIEYDGRVKYEQRPTEAIVAEKRRHDAVADEGWRVIRVTKEDLAPGVLEKRAARFLPASVTAGFERRRELVW